MRRRDRGARRVILRRTAGGAAIRGLAKIPSKVRGERESLRKWPMLSASRNTVRCVGVRGDDSSPPGGSTAAIENGADGRRRTSTRPSPAAVDARRVVRRLDPIAVRLRSRAKKSTRAARHAHRRAARDAKVDASLHQPIPPRDLPRDEPRPETSQFFRLPPPKAFRRFAPTTAPADGWPRIERCASAGARAGAAAGAGRVPTTRPARIVTKCAAVAPRPAGILRRHDRPCRRYRRADRRARRDDRPHDRRQASLQDGRHRRPRAQGHLNQHLPRASTSRSWGRRARANRRSST